MVFNSNMISLEELRSAITQSYPGIEQQLKLIFAQHDIAGDDQLPYGVVEPLLRHFLVKCGLGDYITELTNSEGILSHSRISSFLKGTSMSDIRESSIERLVSSEEMIIMAIIWLKVISDMYQKEESTSVFCGAPFCFTAPTFVTQSTAINGALSSEESMIQSEMIQQPTIQGEMIQSEIMNQGDMIEQSQIQQSEMIQQITPENINQVEDIQSILCGQQQQYTEHICDEAEEEEIRQKNVEHYIQTLVDEASSNRKKGVKCFVYTAAMTPNGSCTSAGAAVPQRRPRMKGQKRPTAGCC